MEIVIKIPDRLIKKVKDHYVNPYEIDEICEAILDGTPLPEHHGRLIDYGYVVDAIDDWINAEEYKYTNATDYLRKRVKDTPTIIEAEGSDSE